MFDIFASYRWKAEPASKVAWHQKSLDFEDDDKNNASQFANNIKNKQILLSRLVLLEEKFTNELEIYEFIEITNNSNRKKI
jgi:hypothetical protein